MMTGLLFLLFFSSWITIQPREYKRKKEELSLVWWQSYEGSQVHYIIFDFKISWSINERHNCSIISIDKRQRYTYDLDRAELGGVDWPLYYVKTQEILDEGCPSAHRSLIEPLKRYCTLGGGVFVECHKALGSYLRPNLHLSVNESPLGTRWSQYKAYGKLEMREPSIQWGKNMSMIAW